MKLKNSPKEIPKKFKTAVQEKYMSFTTYYLQISFFFSFQIPFL